MFIPIEWVLTGGMFASLAIGYIVEEVRNKKAASAENTNDQK